MSAFYTGYRLNSHLGWWGKLRSALGNFLPAALGNTIFTLDEPRVACLDPTAPITDPLGSSNRTATAKSSFSVRAKKRQGAFTR